MSNPNHLMRAAFDAPNLLRKSIGRRAYLGLLIATTGAIALGGGSAAHSGPAPCKSRSSNRQVAHAGSGPESGPTAAQSVGGLLHHQPTPDTVQNAERKANSDAAAALNQARQADLAGSAVACLKALDEAKHHWVIPPLS